MDGLKTLLIASATLSLLPIGMTLPPAVADQIVITQRQTLIAESVPVARSNYPKRLSDLLERIEMALQKGWLSARQGEEFIRWHGDLVKEEGILRAEGGGIIARSKVDQMERHMNGLAYTVSRHIDAQSK